MYIYVLLRTTTKYLQTIHMNNTIIEIIIKKGKLFLVLALKLILSLKVGLSIKKKLLTNFVVYLLIEKQTYKLS